jgi:hypothetical protein
MHDVSKYNTTSQYDSISVYVYISKSYFVVLFIILNKRASENIVENKLASYNFHRYIHASIPYIRANNTTKNFSESENK